MLSALATACAPDLNVRASRVVTERVVAVRATPAEARPGETVRWQAIVVSPEGVPSTANIDWGICLAPRGPADSITVSGTCLGNGPQENAAGEPLFLALDATSLRVNADIPSDACSKVGPQVPPTSDNGTPQRAPDADLTGGYQLPVRLVLNRDDSQDVSMFRQRIRCNLANAPASVARDYATRYTPNQHPVPDVLQIVDESVPTNGTGAIDATRGAHIPIAIGWPETARESYVRVSPLTRQVEDVTETLEVTWFTNGGSFAHDRTAPEVDGLQSSNVLELDPAREEPVTVWVLLHDDRGGVTAITFMVYPS